MPTLIEDASIETVHLSFEQTVPRSLVHKHSIENVLLTEVRSGGDDRFICAGRVPTAHRFFNDAGRTPQKDILFYTELGRQASLAISHTFLGVSREDVFIFEQSQAAMTEAAWGPVLQSHRDSVIVEIRIQETERRRNNAVARVVADHFMSVGNEQVFHGTGAWTVQPPALFQRLRRMSGRSALVPNPIRQSDLRMDRPGREGRDNVVIFVPEYSGNPAEVAASLIVDSTNPYFFDHPCDHVPGMLLLEGCAQLAMAVVSKTASVPARQLGICGYDVNFVQFVERDFPITLTAHLHAAETNSIGVLPPTVHVSISQQNVVSGTATMSVAFAG